MRVMLLGTALLTAIDHLIEAGLFQDGSQIRNIGFVLGLFLEFAVVFEETCTTNEDGWRLVVVQRADLHNVEIYGAVRTTGAMQCIRSAIDEKENEEEWEKEEAIEHEEKRLDNKHYPSLTDGPNYVRAYIPPLVKFLLKPGECQETGVLRSWNAWDWKQEVNIPSGGLPM